MKREQLIKSAIIVSGVLTIIIGGVMNLYFAPLIESTTQGIRMFDMQSFGYSFETAKNFVSSLSSEGRDTYLNKQLPLDFFYPAIYTIFFSLSLLKLKAKKTLIIFTLTPMICDYCENAFSEIMLRTDFTKTVSSIASVFTILKSLFLYAVIILVIVYFVRWIISGKNKKAASDE